MADSAYAPLNSDESRDCNILSADARSANVRRSSSALKTHNPRSLESYLDHVYAQSLSDDTRHAHFGNSVSALQAYGPFALASLLDYYFALNKVKDKCMFFLAIPLVFVALPHALISFIFLYSHGRPLPLYLLSLPLLYLGRKGSPFILVGLHVFIYSFDGFSFTQALFASLFGYSPRVVWLCVPLQLTMYCTAMIIVHAATFPVVLRSCVTRVPRSDAVSLKRNWLLARAGVVVVLACFFFMCCLDSARLHPFSSTSRTAFNVSSLSVSTSIRSFDAVTSGYSSSSLAACVISREGRLFCSDKSRYNELRRDKELRRDSDGSIGVFDVIGLHDFNYAYSSYGFGMPLLLPNFMGIIGNVEHVSVGGSHICAITTSYHRLDRNLAKFLWFWPWYSRDEMTWSLRNYSAVTCWGYNDHGQLGLGFVTDVEALDSYHRTPDEVPQFSASTEAPQPSIMLPDDKVVHLVTGHCHTCARTLSGFLFCWGCNTFGQVGSPLHCSHESSWSCKSPAAVSFLHMNITVTIFIAAAADNTCAIAGPNRVVVCWGRNNQAQLGRSAAAPHPFAPVEENTLRSHSEHPWFVDGLPGGAVSLALGREHACAQFLDGLLWCWGSNQWGQLGVSACKNENKCRRPVVISFGNIGSSPLPSPVPNVFCAGNRITCALVDSKVRCVGAFHNMSLANLSSSWSPALQDSHISDSAVSLACSVNDDSSRLRYGMPRYGDGLQSAVESGSVEGLCVVSALGRVSCNQGQFCNETEESCSDSLFVTASVSEHERIIFDLKGGCLLFIEYMWHLFLYYYVLFVSLQWAFSRKPHRGSPSQSTQLYDVVQIQDCAAQVRSILPQFTLDAALKAASATDGNLQAAVSWLLEHPGAPYEDVMRFLGLTVIEKIGEGGFGSVFRCSSVSERGRQIAIKVISNVTNSKDALFAELEGQRLATCNHENIVRMYKLHLPPTLPFPGVFVFEMEYVSGGDLRQHLMHRLPHDCVLRFTRQLLNALIYLHDTKQLLHGDIKPQNILIVCHSLPSDGSRVDHSTSILKLADFGLAKSLAPTATNDATTRAGCGTEWYMSSEALKGYPRRYADDIWSLCLVILEMDTGMPLQQLMQGPGSVNMNALLIHTSPELLPMLYSVLQGHGESRCLHARDLLRHLDICTEAIFEWQVFDGSQFVAVCAAAALVLENAFISGAFTATLHLPPPLDLVFDFKEVCDKADGLGTQKHVHSGSCPRIIRRMLKPFVLSSCSDIPIWQQLDCWKDWKQCSPQLCAKLEFESRRYGTVNVVAPSRRLLIQRSTLGLIPFHFQSEPYCVSILNPHGSIDHPSVSHIDITALSARVHESLPEFDITNLDIVVNRTLEVKYSGYRQRIAMRCNGNPNERFLFHFCPDVVIPKIWQEGEGHDPRLSQWAEVGKGAYFSEHVIYGYAYRFGLWEGSAEPAIGESFHVFVTLVALGNCKDLGEGCGTCTSPEWEEWKKEFAPMKIEKPTRPPEFFLPSDAGARKHRLDLMGVKDKPRYDSVMSTEGDLGTSPASTYMNKTNTHLVRDVMHPRLRLRSRDWGRQYVVFESAASYPMYILTLTKQRSSPAIPAPQSP